MALYLQPRVSCTVHQLLSCRLQTIQPEKSIPKASVLIKSIIYSMEIYTSRSGFVTVFLDISEDTRRSRAPYFVCIATSFTESPKITDNGWQEQHTMALVIKPPSQSKILLMESFQIFYMYFIMSTLFRPTTSSLIS